MTHAVSVFMLGSGNRVLKEPAAQLINVIQHQRKARRRNLLHIFSQERIRFDKSMPGLCDHDVSA